MGHGIVGTDAAVGPHFEHEFVVIRLLADTSIFHLEIDFTDRRKYGVYRNYADRLPRL